MRESQLSQAGSPIFQRRDINLGLLDAVISGDIQEVKTLLEHKANPNYTRRRQAISSQATIYNNALIAEATASAETFEETETPLSLAIDHDRKEIAELLLEEGANPNQTVIKEDLYCHPLYLAVTQKREYIASLLLEQIEQKTTDFELPSRSSVKLFVDIGNRRNELKERVYNMSLLHLSIHKNLSRDFIQTLIDKKVIDINHKTYTEISCPTWLILLTVISSCYAYQSFSASLVGVAICVGAIGFFYNSIFFTLSFKPSCCLWSAKPESPLDLADRLGKSEIALILRNADARSAKTCLPCIRVPSF